MVAMNAPFEQMNALSETIARRAFEIFQSRGRTDGRDLEDWFQAEAELLHTAHLHLYESDDALAVSAEVPGFAAEELSISVEPCRLTITGKRATNHKGTRRVLYCDACADRIFRAMGLPVEVDPRTATAALRNGVQRMAADGRSRLCGCSGWEPELHLSYRAELKRCKGPGPITSFVPRTIDATELHQRPCPSCQGTPTSDGHHWCIR
jgi:HSP20 family molecular chaperone IbpA